MTKRKPRKSPASSAVRRRKGSRKSSRARSLRRPVAIGVAILALFALGLYFGERLLERGRRLLTAEAPLATPSREAKSRQPAQQAERKRAFATDVDRATGGAGSSAPAVPKGAADPAVNVGSAESTSAAAARRPGATGEATARIAIVIDDLGRQVGTARTLLEIDPNLTFAILPFEPKSAEIAAFLASHGAEILLHLPMAPEGRADPGPGALSEGMSKRQLARATREALAALPSVVGVNNHMGSAVTADRDAMRSVIAVLAERRLFFLDSRTSAESVGFEVARTSGIPSARRDFFLDEVRERGAIEVAIDELVELGRRRGSAIGIAHPRPETLEALADRVPRFREMGVELVPVSFLLERSEELPE